MRWWVGGRSSRHGVEKRRAMGEETGSTRHGRGGNRAMEEGRSSRQGAAGIVGNLGCDGGSRPGGARHLTAVVV
jgi:hypothetical protein